MSESLVASPLSPSLRWIGENGALTPEAYRLILSLWSRTGTGVGVNVVTVQTTADAAAATAAAAQTISFWDDVNDPPVATVPMDDPPETVDLAQPVLMALMLGDVA